MRKFLFIIVAFCASYGFSAQINWGAWYLDSAFANGTAYLIQSNSTVNVDTIASALQQGIPEDIPASYTNWDSGTVTSSSGITYFTRNPGVSIGSELPSVDHWFVVVVSDDRTSFAISQEMTAQTSTTIMQGLDFNLNMQTGGAVSDNYWTVVDGRVEPDVPEPTALALLALGVAGVALRRRIR